MTRVLDVDPDRSEHNGWRAAVILSALVVYTITTVFITLAWVGNNGLFTQSTFTVLFGFPLEITPDFWAQWMLIPTYVIQFVWLLYGVSTICRKAPNGVYIYQLDIVPPLVYILFMFGNLIQIAWLFVWDREVFVAALSLYVVFFITLVTTIVVAIVYLNRNFQMLTDMKMDVEIVVAQNFVQGALITYAVVILIYSLIILGIIMAYRGIVSILWSSTIVLIIRTVVFTFYFFLDIFLLRKYLPSVTLTPYFAGVISLSAVISASFSPGRQNSIFTLSLLILHVCFFIIRVMLIFSTKAKGLSNPLSIFQNN